MRDVATAAGPISEAAATRLAAALACRTPPAQIDRSALLAELAGLLKD
jgi:hypothetical protein